MKFFLKFVIRLCFAFSGFLSFAQDINSQIIKTTEAYDANHKRRIMFFSKDLQLRKEEYYTYDKGTILSKIEYTDSQKIKNIEGYNSNGQLSIKIDFEKGLYDDLQNDTHLKFFGNFIFNGLQRGNNIIVNYLNGKRQGRLIQTDSAASGEKIVNVKQVDFRYLRFNILKFYNSIEVESKYALFKGLSLNFSEDLLDGQQLSNYKDGQAKFNGEFLKGKLINYISYDNNKSVVTRIITNNGISNSVQILNGTPKSDNAKKIFYYPDLFETGVISCNYWDRGNSNNSFSYNISYKAKLDEDKYRFNNVEELFTELDIPKFNIKRFDFDVEEDNRIEGVYFNDTIKFENNYYLIDNPKVINYSLSENVFIPDEYSKNITTIKNKLRANYLKKVYSISTDNVIIGKNNVYGDGWQLAKRSELKSLVSAMHSNYQILKNRDPEYKKEFSNTLNWKGKHDLDIEFLNHLKDPYWISDPSSVPIYSAMFIVSFSKDNNPLEVRNLENVNRIILVDDNKLTFEDKDYKYEFEFDKARKSSNNDNRLVRRLTIINCDTKKIIENIIRD